jgi:hypothetical protein
MQRRWNCNTSDDDDGDEDDGTDLYNSHASATSKKKTYDLSPILFKTAIVPASPEGVPKGILRTFGQ